MAAWVPLPLVVVLIGVGVYYWKLAYDINGTPDSPSLVAITSFAMVTFATFGGLIAHHRPRNPIGWIFCGAALLIALRGASFSYVTWALASPASDLPARRGVAWFSNWIWPPAIASLGIPTG